MTVQEILVKTEEEATFLREKVEHGMDMGILAEEHTLRRTGKGSKGIFHVHPFEKPTYGNLIDAAQDAQTGQLIGPLQVTVPVHELLTPDSVYVGTTYYSLFKVLDTTRGKGPDPFDKVKKRAIAFVRREKGDRAFDRFLSELRLQYEPRITLYKSNVEEWSE
jgi:hypothetical protein